MIAWAAGFGEWGVARAPPRRSTVQPPTSSPDDIPQAGVTAHRYVLAWSAAGNRFGNTHGIDVALLFGTEESWSDAAMLAGASWDEIEQAGSAVRAL